MSQKKPYQKPYIAKERFQVDMRIAACGGTQTASAISEETVNRNLVSPFQVKNNQLYFGSYPILEFQTCVNPDGTVKVGNSDQVELCYQNATDMTIALANQQTGS